MKGDITFVFKNDLCISNLNFVGVLFYGNVPYGLWSCISLAKIHLKYVLCDYFVNEVWFSVGWSHAFPFYKNFLISYIIGRNVEDLYPAIN